MRILKYRRRWAIYGERVLHTFRMIQTYPKSRHNRVGRSKLGKSRIGEWPIWGNRPREKLGKSRIGEISNCGPYRGD